MSIMKAMSRISEDKLIIPCAGKMFKSNITKVDKALCLVLNKGYLETTSYDNMLNYITDLERNPSTILVGNTDKIISKTDLYYRQRVFFHSLVDIADYCKVNALRLELSKDFRISINNVLNCLDSLKYLERYAYYFEDTIDDYLTNVCKLRLNLLLKSLGSYSSLSKQNQIILGNKAGYLDRAPFLSARYSIDNKTSAVFLNKDYSDLRLYNPNNMTDSDICYGFTESNIAYDKKRGLFNECKSR